MSYLLDKKAKNKKLLNIALLIFVLIILAYFRAGISNVLSALSHALLRPVLVAGRNIGESFADAGAALRFKVSLQKENENLKLEIKKRETMLANYNSILAENLKFKEILGRKSATADFILAGILSKPNHSPYDTLLIDAGEEEGVAEGKTVFALGNLPIGRVDSVFGHSSKVILFSNPGERIEGVISGKDIFVELVGRGGGNFEVVLQRDLILEKGGEVVLPGVAPYPLAIAQTIISDPREPLKKVLLSSPVNVQELKFVEVQK